MGVFAGQKTAEDCPVSANCYSGAGAASSMVVYPPERRHQRAKRAL